METRIAATFFSFALLMAVAGGTVSAAEEPSPEIVEALESLVGVLEKLAADPEGLEAALAGVEKSLGAKDQVPRERAQIQSTRGGDAIDLIESQLDELERELESARGGLESLESKLGPLEAALRGAIATPAAERTELKPAARAPTRAKTPAGSRTVSFNRDIRPILSNTCFACHGPDESKRKAGLRLDDGVRAFEELKSGLTPIVPGDRSASELFARVSNSKAADKMPPPASGKELSAEQIEMFGRWIDEGADWQIHWSFIKPERPALPDVAAGDWPRNPIDAFILARLEKEGLRPAAPASPETLLRRVSLDITGLPPTLEELEAFTGDEGEEIYRKVLDRLFASPRYGEHRARYWLDAARYADTNGYHIDNERFMWRWRDWVIEAYNANMPFDRFTIEQLAGDLLPEPTLEQRIATGFHRNHMVTFEGGIIPEEYRNEYVVDRVNTTGTVWLGLTIGCSQCHDHKYDPITQREFYQFAAFFNTIEEKGSDGRNGNAVPLIQAPNPDQAQSLERLDAKIAGIEKEMNAPMEEIDTAQAEWEQEWRGEGAGRWQALDPIEFTSSGWAGLKKLDDLSILSGGANPKQEVYELTARTDLEGITAVRLEALTHELLPEGGAGRAENANFALGEFEVEAAPASAPEQWTKVVFAGAEADYSQRRFNVEKAIDGDPKTGWAVDGDKRREDRTAVFVAAEPFGFGQGTRLRIRLRHETGLDHHAIGRFRLSVTTEASMAVSEFGDWYLNGPFTAADGNAAYEKEYGPERGIELDETYEDGRLKWVAAPEFEDAKPNRLRGEVAATYLYRTIEAPSPRRMTLALASNDALKVWLNGRVVLDKNVQRSLKRDEDRITIDLEAGENALLLKVVNYGNDYAFYFRKAAEQFGEVPLDVERFLALEPAERTEGQSARLRAHYRKGNSEVWRELKRELTALEDEKKALEKEIPTAMVMAEMKERRETFLLKRGKYDEKGEKVEAGVPASLPPLPEGAEADRLGLARWLVSPENPLTARVIVNRLWQEYFGIGLVKSAENFGSQGEWPSHPDLLDWLATEFIANGWDLRHIQRLIVTSAAYRQSSAVSEELVTRDPENRLLARGPRFRMDAEMVRDNALVIAGLLVEKRGGPSVSPYQPPGLWKEVAYGDGFSAQVFEQGEGSDLYRRSLYTFWKRQSPPPSMMIFDAPNRETCVVRRARTNTPLQALALLNDPQFIEASRRLAQRAMTEVGESPAERAAHAFRLATARRPNERELAALTETFEAQLAEYRADEEAAALLIAVGDSTPNEDLDPCELAAWTIIASMILNLDETMTKG